MIHQTVITGKNTEIGENVEIGPYTVIGDNVKIGNNTKIGPQVVIEGPTTIGENSHIFQFCSLGAIPQDLKFQEEDTELIIGDNNTFREYVTIGAQKAVPVKPCLKTIFSLWLILMSHTTAR